MKERITEILIALKAIGLPKSTIEFDLKFSNGLLGKAAKGISELSDEKLQMLEKYFAEKIPTNKPTEKQVVVTPKAELKSVPSKQTVARMSEVMKELNKRFGEGTIMTLGDKPTASYSVVSSGSIGLDDALGIGGFPLGRIVEIFGMESSGKTTIAIHALANAQKRGLKCLYVDAENAFDIDYANALGVDVDSLQYCQPSCGEDALEVTEKMILSGEAQVVVIDSVAALVPRAELLGEMGESKMGLHARLMSQACRKLVNITAKQNALVIFINQIRHKIGVMFGSPEVTTGGLALQFYATMRLNVSRSTTEKNSQVNDEGEKEGNLTTVRVIKNKCSAPFKTAQFNIMYGQGIDAVGEVAVIGIKNNLLKGKYATVRENLISDADLYEKTKQQIIKLNKN